MTNAAYNRIGTGATSRGLAASTDLLIGGKLEVDGTLYADGTVEVAGTLYADGASVLSGNVYLGGTSGPQYGRIWHSTAPDDELVLHSEADLALLSQTRRVRVGDGSGDMDFEGFCLGFGGLGLHALDPGSRDVSSSNYAVLFVDSTDGDLKVRFPNGTLKTIATND